MSFIGPPKQALKVGSRGPGNPSRSGIREASELTIPNTIGVGLGSEEAPKSAARHQQADHYVLGSKPGFGGIRIRRVALMYRLGARSMLPVILGNHHSLFSKTAPWGHQPAIDAGWRTFANEPLPWCAFCDQISRRVADRRDLVSHALKETPHG